MWTPCAGSSWHHAAVQPELILVRIADPGHRLRSINGFTVLVRCGPVAAIVAGKVYKRERAPDVPLEQALTNL